jgi:hypothetical protein
MTIPTRTYTYWAAGIVVALILVVGGVIALNKNTAKKGSVTQTSSKTTDDQVKPITSGDVKTPVNNDELSNTLNDDASSIDASLKNYENSDYNDSNLTDNSLYN